MAETEQTAAAGDGLIRTFTARAETRRGVITHMLPEDGEPIWVVQVEPLTRADPGGGTRTSVGFPICVLTGWVAEPEKIAQRIAEILTEARL